MAFKIFVLCLCLTLTLGKRLHARTPEMAEAEETLQRQLDLGEIKSLDLLLGLGSHGKDKYGKDKPGKNCRNPCQHYYNNYRNSNYTFTRESTLLTCILADAVSCEAQLAICNRIVR